MRKGLIIAGAIGAVGVGGYFFYREQYRRLQNISFKLEGIKVNSISLKDVDIDLKIRLISEATIEAVVTDLNLDVFVNDVKVGVVTGSSPIIIPAKGYSIADLKVKSNVSEVAKDAVNLGTEIYKSKSANVRISGTATIKSWIIKIKNAPIDYTTVF